MKGILIYGFNNSRVDYFRQAVWSADRVTRHLGLPVTIVTDVESHAGRSSKHNIVYSRPESGGDRIYNPSADQTVDVWINGNRYQSWDLSPYEETIVLDSDYVVCSDQLMRLFEGSVSVTAVKDVYDVTGRDGFAPYRWISERRGLHHYWATVIYFRRDQLSQDFFNMMAMIRENYRHYSEIYRFSVNPFRNDFAASIALTTIYGHLPDSVPVVPWQMASAFGDVEISTVDQDTFDLYYTVGLDRKHQRTGISGQDFHFMNKVGLAKLYAD